MKKVCILVCLLFLTGCTANYEITLKNNKIQEKLTLIETNQSLFEVENDTGWTLRQVFESLVENKSDEFSKEDYSVKSLNTDTQLGVEYNSNSTNALTNSSVINQCYTNPTIEVEDNIVTFKTGDDFRCYEYYDNLEYVNIILKIDYSVISSNADAVEDNKYIWNITKDGNKNIEISYEEYKVKDNNYMTIIFIGIIIIVVGIILYYVYNKSKEENKI